MIHIYATHDLSKVKRKTNKEPISGRWMTPTGAARHLAYESVVVPGVAGWGWRWSGMWKRPSAPSAPRTESPTFDLREQPGDLMRAALEEAESNLKAQLGADVNYWDLTPKQIEEIWLPMVLAAIDHQWYLRKNPGASG